MDILLYILTLVLTLVVAIVPSFFPVIKVGRGRNNQKITKSGKWVLSLIVLIIAVQTFQYIQNLNEEKLKESRYNEGLDKRDSSNNVLRIESNNEIVKTFSDALGKYALKYDSTENIIKRIVRDSSKTTNNILVKTPEIVLKDIILDSTKSGHYYFSIEITSLEATAYNLNLKLRMSEAINFKFHQVYSFSHTMPQGSILELNRITVPNVKIYDLTVVDAFVFYIYGSYSGIDGLQKSFDRIYLYSFKEPKGLTTLRSEKNVNTYFHRKQP